MAHAAVEEARIASRHVRRNHDPLAWAQARQLLGHALIQLAHEEHGGDALATFEEAEAVLAEAIAVAGPDANPGFLASMQNLHGYAAFYRGELLHGDAKGRAYAEAAERFTAALAKVTPESQRALWVELGFYRGTVLQALGASKDGPDAAACFEEAAASFRAVAERGLEDGKIHPIAAYNLHVVLQNRAGLAPGRAALPYLTESRDALLRAMADPAFAAHQADHASRLAALDAAIGVARAAP